MIDGRKIVQSRPLSRTAGLPRRLRARRIRTARRASSPSRSCAGSGGRPRRAPRRRRSRPLRGASGRRSAVPFSLMMPTRWTTASRPAAARASEAGSRTSPSDGLDRRGCSDCCVFSGWRARTATAWPRVQQPVDDVRSDEARAAGDENLHDGLYHVGCLGRWSCSRRSGLRRRIRAAERLTLDAYGYPNRSLTSFLPSARIARTPPRACARRARSRIGSATRSGGSPDCRVPEQVAGAPRLEVLLGDHESVRRRLEHGQAPARLLGGARSPRSARTRRAGSCDPRGRAAGGAGRGRRPRRSRRPSASPRARPPRPPRPSSRPGWAAGPPQSPPGRCGRSRGGMRPCRIPTGTPGSAAADPLGRLPRRGDLRGLAPRSRARRRRRARRPATRSPANR